MSPWDTSCAQGAAGSCEKRCFSSPFPRTAVWGKHPALQPAQPQGRRGGEGQGLSGGWSLGGNWHPPRCAGEGVPGASARHPGLGALGLPFPGCGVSSWCRGNGGETPWGRRWSFRELPAGAAAGGSRSGQGRPWGPPHEEPLLRPWGCRERVLRPHTTRGHIPQVGPENSSPASLPPRIGELESGKEGAF